MRDKSRFKTIFSKFDLRSVFHHHHDPNHETDGDAEDETGSEPPPIESNSVVSKPISIQAVPEGPVQFESVGDGDAFIHKLLVEKHIETKEQLFAMSLRPTSFDYRDELKAKLEAGKGHHHEGDHQVMTSKKMPRMHFIGSYNFAKAENFEDDHHPHL